MWSPFPAFLLDWEGDVSPAGHTANQQGLAQKEPTKLWRGRDEGRGTLSFLRPKGAEELRWDSPFTLSSPP